MNKSEFKNLVDDQINVHENLKSLSNYLRSNPSKNNLKELAKLDELIDKFQSLGALISLESKNTKSFSKIIQVDRAVAHIMRIEDFFEEYEYLYKKEQSGKNFTENEASRYVELIHKVGEMVK